MLIKKPVDIRSYEITPKHVYRSRRAFMQSMAVAAGAAAAGISLRSEANYPDVRSYPAPDWLRKHVHDAQPGPFGTDEDVTPYIYASSYNNFYEFGMDKEDPAEHAEAMVTDPWSVEVSGECENGGTFAYEDIIKAAALEERVYRLRCVEAWSMVIPWIGLPLGDLLKRFKPLSSAKFVEFTTLYAPDQMPGQRSFFSAIDYPYVEGLRMDEAMHPLAIMAVGMYGDVIPPQNGAPMRLVVPWKYGFKSIKSIVAIRFTAREPMTTWEKQAPNEYGFYANVNPEVDHPRWSQKTERRLPSSLFSPNRIDTRMFNGYAEEVAHLYSGMNLRRYF